MVRNCACHSSASVISASGRAVPPSLIDAARCLAHSGGCLAHSVGAVCDGGVSCLAWRKRASAALSGVYWHGTPPSALCWPSRSVLADSMVFQHCAPPCPQGVLPCVYGFLIST